MSFSCWMDKPTVVHPHNGILPNNKEWTIDTVIKMDNTQTQFSKWNKSYPKATCCRVPLTGQSGRVKTSWTKNWPLVCQGLRGRGAFANKKAACMGELFRGRELFFFLSVVVVRWLCVFVMSQNDTLKRINFIMWIEKNQLRHIWFKTSNEFKSIFIECLLWAGPGWVVWGK